MLDWYLKEWLKSCRVSQAELCRRTDYPKAKVSDLVTGKQRYNRDILNDIADALHVRPFELLMPPGEAMALRSMREAVATLVPPPETTPPAAPPTAAAEKPRRTGTRG